VRRSASFALWGGALALVLAAPAAAKGTGRDVLDSFAVQEVAPSRIYFGAARLSVLGRWKGRLHQRGVQPFTVTATIRGFDALSRNTVHYTGIDCSGHWTYLTRSGRSYQFREVITSGRGGKCKGFGRVTLTQVDAKHARYAFRGGGVVSRGVLTRVKPRR
jgi:hypothetical protein